MFVCLYVCTYVRIYVCSYVCMYVCIYVRMYVCTYVRMYACTYVRMYVCTYVRTYVCMYVCSPSCAMKTVSRIGLEDTPPISNPPSFNQRFDGPLFFFTDVQLGIQYLAGKSFTIFTVNVTQPAQIFLCEDAFRRW